MRTLLPQSPKWGPVIEVLLAAVLFGSGLTTGIEAFHTAKAQTHRVVDARPRISSKATYAQVVANFAGAPYVSGQLSELPGFQCQGWTAGATGHGWVVIRCSK